MRDAPIISELRAALRRRGVWGARGERLMQDWREHVEDDAARRVEGGAEAEAARETAWKALGNSNVLAASAARELARGSWLGRHPWLGGIMLPALGWMGVAAAVVVIPALMADQLGWEDFTDSAKLVPALRCWALVVNWLPWLLSVAWIAWIAARMPGGWKLYWITVAVLTICAPAIKMAVYPPVHGPHTGIINISFPVGIISAISAAIQDAIGHLPVIGPRFQDWMDDLRDGNPVLPAVPRTGAWIQTTITLLGAAAFYLRAIAARRSTVETHAG